VRWSGGGCRERAAQDVSGQGRRLGDHHQLTRTRDMLIIVPDDYCRSQANISLATGSRVKPAWTTWEPSRHPPQRPDQWTPEKGAVEPSPKLFRQPLGE